MPEDAPAYIALAEEYARADNYNKAADAYTVALRFDERSIKALCGLADANLRLGDPEQARRALGRALAIDAEHPKVLKVQAELQARSGRFDAAVQSLHLAAEIDSYKRRFK
ncbi:MAG: tetratricopeptide repeat protein [Planctomycetota bacterium]